MNDNEVLWSIYHSHVDEWRRIWAARKLLVAYDLCTSKESQDLPLTVLFDIVADLEAGVVQ